MAHVGRNDPCPCGSGRKYKHCCLRAADADETARVRLRTVEGILIPALVSYVDAEFGDAFFDEAWEEFFAWDAVPETTLIRVNSARRSIRSSCSRSSRMPRKMTCPTAGQPSRWRCTSC